MSSEECSSWFSSSGLSFVVSPGSINSCGGIVLYRPVLSLVSSSSDSNGRFLLCNFSFHDVPFRVACVYAPNYVPERDNFFSDVASRVDPSVPTVIVGDFNTVFDRAIDRMGSVVGDVSRESSVSLGRLFSDVCCIDIWRYLHPSSSGFTWTKADGSLSSRIDLIGCPYIWVLEILEGAAIGRSPGSDGLSAEFYLAFWKVLGEDLIEVFKASFSSGLCGALVKGPAAPYPS